MSGRRWWHRHRDEGSGFPEEWRSIVAARLPGWDHLDADERASLELRTLDLLADTTWEAARGFELTDEMMVTIASEAARLIVGLRRDAYRLVSAIIVHPTTVVLTGQHSQVQGLVSDAPMPIAGQAQQYGPVIVTWDAVEQSTRHPERGHNVVFHEFAHKIDMLGGDADGRPPIADRQQAAEWEQVCTEAYERVATGEGSLVLRPYAGVNPGEFFAVATEAFFTVPAEVRQHERALYGVLSAFYRQDPAGP